MIPEYLRDNSLASALDDVAVTAKFEFNELTVEVAPANIAEALRRAKHQLNFERLSTVTAVDRYPAEPRFEIVYHLQSIAGKQRLRLKARLHSNGGPGENPEIESAFAVYRSANWYEREVFDLFGVRFLNHPNLTRIMLPDDWVGHPLRKDVPVTGTRY
jgi:NADH-quinone oxidoreductase subunit C